MIRIFISLMFALASLTSALASRPVWWCERSDGLPCSRDELADPLRFRQILFLPTGFREDEEWLFRAEVTRTIRSMMSGSERVYASRYRDQLVYLAYWLPGGDLGSPESQFGAAVAPHPIRGKALTLRLDDVTSTVSEFSRFVVPGARPIGVGVLYNDVQEDVTANASPPSFLGSSFGVAKFNRKDLDGSYVAAHELAHASFNFLDEYVEPGLENMSVRMLDYLTPLAVFTSGWSSWIRAIGDLLGVYDYNVSEILAANGSDNMDVSRYPSRVVTDDYVPNEYEYEGGMFFGRGTYHDRGDNLMNDDEFWRGDGDGFAYDHSPSQESVLEQVFGHPHQASRPNDRLRNAGPLAGWSGAWGPNTHVMVFDADKNHQFHPTHAYDIQVGWYERDWKVCKKGFIPYPCYKETWRVAQKQFVPDRRVIEIESSKLYGLASLAQNIVCQLGIKQIKSGDGAMQLCTTPLSGIAKNFLPTLAFPLPYQDMSVPSTQWWTRYYWRFRTNNGSYRSGWTSWASFYRYF